MRGSGCATASAAESNALSGSYTTVIRSSAAVAAPSVVAATAATGSPTNRTLSTQRVCSSWETGRIPNGIGRSRPVRTACTPSRRFAAAVSIDVMRACGCVLRKSLQYSMRGKARSSAKRVAPVTLATASTLRSALPITRWADGRMGGSAERLPAIQRFSCWFDLFPAHTGRSQFNRLVDLDVSGAAAQVAGERFLDLVSCWVRIVGKQCFGGEQERGRAAAALRCAAVAERLLQRMQLAALRHSFDGTHGLSRAREAEYEAR